MKNKGKDYYLNLINSLEIAEEIITSSEMEESTKKVFSTILAEAKNQPFPSEDWSILRERLAGWLATKNENTAY